MLGKDNAPGGFVRNMSIDTSVDNPNESCELSSGNLHGNFVVFDPSKEPNTCYNGQWLPLRDDQPWILDQSWGNILTGYQEARSPHARRLGKTKHDRSRIGIAHDTRNGF
ncbi:hypothetical protein CQW23_22430 [Capsicum baccatum]|uniref:Uncharacterized protein n=1 Tax=Capsicum baccatum TaxID=33114 RepID=A0A2G2W0U2_CAPBA|nr:hypothetical protein CQW23_22430 [Capsicum baccatum]